MQKKSYAEMIITAIHPVVNTDSEEIRRIDNQIQDWITVKRILLLENDVSH